MTAWPKCSHCGKPMQQWHESENGKKFCSEDCFKTTWPKCDVCSKPMKQWQETNDGLRFCSDECSEASTATSDFCGVPEQECYTQKLPLGAHLVSPRGVYTHHGLYSGNGRVIHYSGLSDGLSAGPVEETTVDLFQSGNDLYVKEHPDRKFPGEESVRRARSRIGEDLYSLFSNNCEHFVNWCIEGEHTSAQVDKRTAQGSSVLSGAVGVGSRAAIASAGSVAGLSGSGVMSGLATVGGAVGGGAVAGLGIIGGSGGLLFASVLNKTVLADNEALDQGERESRAVGRKATYAGAAAGTASSIAAVSAMGTTAGLSGAGITSGLAAIGGTVGGGMAAGAAIAAAAPVAAAAAVGYGLYKVVSWFKN